MREMDARPMAILLEGLPSVMRTEEIAYAIEVYVKTRLVIYHQLKILPCIGLMCGPVQEMVDQRVNDQHGLSGFEPNGPVVARAYH